MSRVENEKFLSEFLKREFKKARHIILPGGRPAFVTLFEDSIRLYTADDDVEPVTLACFKLTPINPDEAP
jgi:hypothetical protein